MKPSQSNFGWGLAGLGGAEHANALTAAQKLGRDYAENLFVTQRKASKRKPSDDDLTLARCHLRALVNHCTTDNATHHDSV